MLAINMSSWAQEALQSFPFSKNDKNCPGYGPLGTLPWTLYKTEASASLELELKEIVGHLAVPRC